MHIRKTKGVYCSVRLLIEFLSFQLLILFFLIYGRAPPLLHANVVLPLPSLLHVVALSNKTQEQQKKHRKKESKH
ncbi:hypothetical protein STCU_11446 [Strigomonas culicis]|uniref:Uncharacterized protein n=1 Tax=Strigomonas culicis TaxID=28005 RepID=S9V0E8_9TRYP|nr:hypothetical protein STCU_11446 [Strigomonas culicis]|eukprot:EPY16255.1 hypothetical protein STCU_11446 [Strigomonas culicis]